MSKVLTEAQRRQYAQDGVVFPVPVLTSIEAVKYRARCDELEAWLGGKPRTIDVRQMHLHFPWACALASHPRILDSIEDLLGPDLLVWATELFSKHPHDPTVSIAWHRDGAYMGFAAGLTVTAWVALADSTPANGCMQVVPRSHERGPSGAPPEEGETWPVALRAGEMSLHDTEVLHGSGPNTSGQKRVGFVIRYVSPEARPLGARPPALLVRGRDRHGYFRLVEPPAERGAEAALAGLHESAVQHLDAVLQNLRHARQGPSRRR
jgi:hypothetical protein